MVLSCGFAGSYSDFKPQVEADDVGHGAGGGEFGEGVEFGDGGVMRMPSNSQVMEFVVSAIGLKDDGDWGFPLFC